MAFYVRRNAASSTAGVETAKGNAIASRAQHKTTITTKTITTNKMHGVYVRKNAAAPRALKTQMAIAAASRARNTKTTQTEHN
jgi:hypothetical protein